MNVNENVYTRTSLQKRRDAVNALETALGPMSIRKCCADGKGLQGSRSMRPALEWSSIVALQYWNPGALLRVRKFQPSVTNLRLARLNWKRPNVVRPPIVRDHPPVPHNLQE